MGFTEALDYSWRVLSVDERVQLLNDLAAETSREARWDGKTALELAQIPSADDLPSELRGRLIMCVTPDGFSVNEFRRTRGVIESL
jgi:hypothetical protein